MESVSLSQGVINGMLSDDGSVVSYLGVRFAAPPVGDLRWRPPHPLQPGGASVNATHSGPICPQYPLPTNSVLPLGDEVEDEDCLFLNVWAPAEQTGERLPVIMWLHLGAFQIGSGSAPIYDGSNWAKAGVVFVTPNYRLNKFGFLAHPALSAEQGGRSGNYGLLDQIAALEWIRDNIAKFGGDPECVTIAGISAGASSVSLLMASPLARGLFHRAICESGGSFGPVAERTSCGDAWQHLRGAEASGQKWADSLGLKDAASLRALSAEEIKVASETDWTDNYGVFDAAQPIVDGAVLEAGSREIFGAGRQAPVPLLVGSAANEDLLVPFSPSLEAYESDGARIYGNHAAEFKRVYPASTDAEAIASSMKANAHRLFTWQNWTMAKLHAAAGYDTYYYRFQMEPPVPENMHPEQALPRPIGAFHGASMFYTFQNFDKRNWPWREEDVALSQAMVEAWVSFARDGKPSSAKLPEWPRFDQNAPRVMQLDARPALGAVPDQPYLDFWDAFNAARGKDLLPEIK